MNLFLDTSVLLAAAGSSLGASREIFRRAPQNAWTLITTPYVVNEVLANLVKLPAVATADWAHLRFSLSLMDDVITLDRPAVFSPAKDRPILFSALAWADILLTLDQADFQGLFEHSFYGLRVMRPATFLQHERTANRLT
jgi:hypothetical protein